MAKIAGPCWEDRLVKWARGRFCWFLGHRWLENGAGTWRCCCYCKTEESDER